MCAVLLFVGIPLKEGGRKFVVVTILILYTFFVQADDPESLVRKFWDLVQPAIGCCGVTSYLDWKMAESG
jgi:hypothetical protein